MLIQTSDGETITKNMGGALVGLGIQKAHLTIGEFQKFPTSFVAQYLMENMITRLMPGGQIIICHNIPDDLQGEIIEEVADNEMVYFQVDQGEIFKPEKIIMVNIEYGFNEVTKPDDKIRSFVKYTHIVTAHYFENGMEIKRFYRHGDFVEIDKKLIFQMSEALL